MLTVCFATAWNLRYDATDAVNEDFGVVRGGCSLETGYGVKNTCPLDKLSNDGGICPESQGALTRQVRNCIASPRHSRRVL